MRKVPLPTVLLLAVALPLHAEPPAPAATHADATVSPSSHAPHSRLGEVMGSLTQALRDAAEQQSHANATPRSAQSTAARNASTASASLPPDATAQATVP